MPRIRGEDALNIFRASWTGPEILKLLHQHDRRLCITWQLGVGKSHSIDDVLETAIQTDQYDLVVVLLPTRQTIRERRWMKTPPSNTRVVHLKPRPRKRCGPDRDALWQQFETTSLGGYGRAHICGPCPRKQGCSWLRQYGEGLRRVQVIFATQAHLERAPAFLLQLKRWTEAPRVLALLDEVNFMMTSFRRGIGSVQLEQFVEILKDLGQRKLGGVHTEWIYRADLLHRAGSEDLRYDDWKMPPIYPDWARTVQECGWRKFGGKFRFLGYDLQQFGLSPIESRERSSSGDISFAALPYLGCDFIIYSGTAHPRFLTFRLGQTFATPFLEYQFEHPETSWYNIASRLGTRSYFPNNAPQILDFFAGLVAQRLREGHRPLLIAKKCFVSLCAREMVARLRKYGIEGVKIITSKWKSADLSPAHAVPLINYGQIGTNLFEHFDCAYCLTGYFVNEDTVNTILQDMLASDLFIPIKIVTTGRPRRRRAGVLHPSDQAYDIHALAQLALGQQEMDPVLQAVGRVRPYTKPREIITFQCARHPQRTYTREFNSIGEARKYFKIPSRREEQQNKQLQYIRQAKERGMTQAQVAREVGKSIRTVKRYWNKKRVP